MKYLLLIYSEEGKDDVDFETLISQYEAFESELEMANIEFSGNALEPVTMATSVKNRAGKMQMTDGPFAETKEQLGGYYVIDLDDIDEASQWAAKIPSARYGTIEVRPIMSFEQD